MRSTLLVGVLALAACAPATDPFAQAPRTTPQPIQSREGEVSVSTSSQGRVISHQLQAAPTEVWDAAVEAYRELGILLSTMSTEEGLLGTTSLAASRSLGGISMVRLLRCGQSVSGPAAATHRIQMSILSNIRPESEGGSEIRTRVEASARAPGSSSGAVQCVSTGRLEEEIATRVRKGLEG